MTNKLLKRPFALLVLILAVAFVSFSGFAQAQHAPNGSTEKQAPAIMPLTPLANQLGQTLQSLVVGTTTTTAAVPEQSADAPIEDSAVQLTYTFATDLLDTMAKAVNAIKANSAPLSANLSALPNFMDWASRQSLDPRRAALWSSLSSDLTIIVGTPLLMAIAVYLLMWPIKLRLAKRHLRTTPERAGVILGLFALRLAPVFVFLGASLLLLDQNETQKLQRFIILNVIYAISLGSTIQMAWLSLLSPASLHVRVLPVSCQRAASAYRWLTSFSAIIVGSYFVIDVAHALRVPSDAVAAFQNLCAVVLSIMAAVVIFKTRPDVAAILKGKSENEEDRESFTAAMRLWLSRHWHALATVYLAAGLAITVMDINHGLALMLRGTILSLLIIATSRSLLIVMEKWRQPSSGGISRMHRHVVAFIMRPLIWIASATGIAATWGADVNAWLTTQSGQRMTSVLISVAIILCTLTAAYETIDKLIDRHLSRKDNRGKPVASARTQTLLPMVRMSAFILFSATAILAGLSSVGVDIAPLLAGAGVIGVAIGFGSQSLVKDFLTGLFIVVENSVTVGDLIKIDAFQGTVETLSIRTMSLRDVDGSLHILPFSEVTRITNMSRGFAYALVDVGVAYDSNLDHVMDIMREIGASMQEDPIFKRIILEPLEVMGIENFGDSSVILRARLRTRPGKQGDVRRWLLLRIKQRFDKEGIEIPFPTVTYITKN